MSNFPQPPHDIGKTHQIGDKIWTWDGEKWFADYDSLAPVFQVKPDEGLVNLNLGIGSDFELALDADGLQELNTPTQLVIGNITITPDNASPQVGDSVIYTYTKDGNVGDDVFLDLSTDIPGAIVTGNTIQYPQLGSGTVTMRVESTTAIDSPVTGTLAVTIVPVATTIGTVTITGDTSPTAGDTVTYGFDITGDALDAVGTLTTNISGASVSGDEIEFLQTGSGYVEYEVTSQTSTDSPVVERLNVTVGTTTLGTITITGDFNPTQGDTVTYGYTITGDAFDATSVLTTDIPNAVVNGDDITFPDDGSGYIEYVVTSSNSSDSPVTVRENVTVAGVPYIGGIIVSGDRSPNQGDTVTYGYTIDGNVTDTSLQSLTTTVPGAVVNGNDITFNQSGSGEVTVTVQSPTATDSPQSSTIQVGVALAGWGDPNNIKIVGEANPTTQAPREYFYEFVFDGNVPDATYSWSSSNNGDWGLINPNGRNPQSFFAFSVGQYTITCVANSATYGSVVRTFVVDVSNSFVFDTIQGPSTDVTQTGRAPQSIFSVTYDGNATSYNWEVENDDHHDWSIQRHTGSSNSTRYLSMDGNLDTYTEVDFVDTNGSGEFYRWFINQTQFPDEVGDIDILMEVLSGEITPVISTGQSINPIFYPSVTATNKTWITKASGPTVNWHQEPPSSVQGQDPRVTMAFYATNGCRFRIYAFRVNSTILKGFRPAGISGANADTAAINFRAPGENRVICTMNGDNGQKVDTKEVQVTKTDATYVVTVDNPGSGNKYFINGVETANITMKRNTMIRLDQDLASNSGHPIRIYKQPNKVDEIDWDQSDVDSQFWNENANFTGEGIYNFAPTVAGTYYYECLNHANMGGTITVT